MYPVERSYRMLLQGLWASTSTPTVWTKTQAPEWQCDKDDWGMLRQRTFEKIDREFNKPNTGIVDCQRCGEEVEWEFTYERFGTGLLSFECDTPECVYDERRCM